MSLDVDKNDVWAMFFGIVMFRVASVFRSVFVPQWPHAVLTVAAAGTGVALLLSPLLPVDWERHGEYVGAWTLVVLLTGLVVLYLTDEHGIATDVQLFVVESAQTTLSGVNPYTVSFDGAIRESALGGATRRLDGTEVTRLSYPGGMVVSMLPQYALGVRDGGALTVTTFAAGLIVFLVRVTPGEMVALPFVFAFGVSALPFVGFLGGLGPLWILPLLLGMFWWGRRPRLAAAAVGWAAASKQLVWPVLPFLALWLWLDADDPRAFLDAARTHLAWGGLAFLLPNLPFLLTAPRAWLAGTVAPVAPGAPLIHYGAGLGWLSITGLFPLTTTAHALLLGVALVAGLGLYARWWPRARWVAFVVPPLLLLVHSRYLGYYFAYFVPVAYYAWLRLQQTEAGESSPPGPVAAARR
jgi:uncharacterized membrane protein